MNTRIPMHLSEILNHLHFYYTYIIKNEFNNKVDGEASYFNVS